MSGLHRLAAAMAIGLIGCAGDAPRQDQRTPESIQADIKALIPARVAQRDAWAVDLQLVFAGLKLPPSTQNVCAVLAVTEQESTFNPDPPVANLATIAREEIMRRADSLGVPELAVNLALKLRSPNGSSYDDRLSAVKTERELSQMYEQFIDEVPLGRRLFANWNPVRTGGPMQVSIAFAEAHVRETSYPFPAQDSVRHEVFTRRGGLYFGTAHLLGYAASAYGPAMIFRFADFNAGRYASRNAAFQQALAVASGRRLDLDGDLFVGASTTPGQTEMAARLSTIPVRTAVRNGPAVAANPILQQSLAQSAHSRPMPTDPRLRQIWDGMKGPYQLVMNGEVSAEEGARQMQENVEKRINDTFLN